MFGNTLLQRALLFILALIIVYHFATVADANAPEGTTDRAEIVSLHRTFDWLQPIPASYNYRGPQPTADQLETLLSTGKIQAVIRMNGNGKDAGALSVEEERTICQRHGVRFYFINAHEGYVPGQGYLGSATKVSVLLNADRVYLHCLHGYHRTGAMTGYWMSKQGFTREAIIRQNGWESLAQQPGEYVKYVETAGL